MIWSVLKIGWQRMLHGKLELLLTFVVPIVFFTIFAMIFDRQLGSSGKLRVRAVVVDNDYSDVSRAIVTELANESTIRELLESDRVDGFTGSAVELAAELVRRGTVSLAVVIPAGWAEAFQGSGSDESPIREIELIADSSNPIAPKIMEALVQRTASKQLVSARQPPAAGIPVRNPPSHPPDNLPADARSTQPISLQTGSQPLMIQISTRDVLAENKANPIVSMYAAGIAVMFLLFSATGHSGSLLDEEDNQTLERLMCSQLNMTQLLIGKWLWLTGLGSLQLCVMFCWAQIAFHVDVLGHLPGFIVMTLVTASAASSFALFMAAACQTRAQLNAVSIVVILSMSALGGSMVPRYIMSERMQELGHYTFNAWALDGFTKVFWRDLPPVELWREVTVLGASAVVLLVSARILARRWETV